MNSGGTALELLCHNISIGSWNRFIENLLFNRRNNHAFDDHLELNDVQYSMLQLNMFGLGSKYLNLFIQVIESVFTPITVIGSMFVLHLLLSKVILEIKSKQNRKSTQTVNKWMHEEAKSKMFLRELKYLDKTPDGSKKLWFDAKKNGSKREKKLI